MSDDAVDVVKVGSPEKAGETREGKSVQLIVLADTAALADGLADAPPNYHVDQMGTVSQLVADDRAGDALGLAIYNKRRYNIDRIAISVMLQRYEDGDYSDDQVRALGALIDALVARHGLGDEALVRLLPDEDGKLRVTASLPPAPGVVDTGLLGAAPLSPQQELWLFLYGETYKPRGGALKIAQALPLHAAKFKLGAPLGPNDATTSVAVDGHTYSVQPFATDLIFYEGTQYAAVQSLNALYDDAAAEIPAGGTARALLEASYRISIATTEKRGPLSATKTLKPDWRFHLVAKNGALGPAVSDNYIFKADQDYSFQVFGADTLYTPTQSEPAGCYRLNLTEPTHLAFNALWGETYRKMGAPFDANSPFHKKAVELRIGVPLTGVYDAAQGGTTYKVQVWTLDTLYAGPDGQIKRMSELPMTAEAQSWAPAAPKPIPPTPPNPLPPAVPPTNAGAPRPNDINWPPRPDFDFLKDKGGAREKALGRIEWVRTNGDNVKITNDFASNIIKINVPQLAKIKGGGNGDVLFHRVAADPFKRLWAAWEAAGLLGKVLMFAGTFVPRTIRNNPRVLSNHAYGTAFDINVQQNGLMKIAAFVGQPGSVRELVPLANAHGFYWGGHWNYDGKGASDGMHFEWAVPR